MRVAICIRFALKICTQRGYVWCPFVINLSPNHPKFVQFDAVFVTLTDCSLCSQEYSEDSNSEPDVDLENQYYNSKALKEDEPEMALQSFQKVLDLENGEKGEWGFKALKQMIKINFKLSNYKEMMYRYKQLLTYIKSAVTRNHSEKSINSILDYISTSKNVSSFAVGRPIRGPESEYCDRKSILSDGITAKFLRDYVGRPERCQKR